MSQAEKGLVSKVISSLENVQYLSIQAVANNDLGKYLYKSILMMIFCCLQFTVLAQAAQSSRS